MVYCRSKCLYHHCEKNTDLILATVWNSIYINLRRYLLTLYLRTLFISSVQSGLFVLYMNTAQEPQLFPSIWSQWNYGIPNWGILWAEGSGEGKRWCRGKPGSSWLFKYIHQTRPKQLQATLLRVSVTLNPELLNAFGSKRSRDRARLKFVFLSTILLLREFSLLAD